MRERRTSPGPRLWPGSLSGSSGLVRVSKAIITFFTCCHLDSIYSKGHNNLITGWLESLSEFNVTSIEVWNPYCLLVQALLNSDNTETGLKFGSWNKNKKVKKKINEIHCNQCCEILEVSRYTHFR